MAETNDILRPTKFGLFLSPLHPLGTDPTWSLRRDCQLAVDAESWGFDEFWLGEHHSGGWATIGSPEVVLGYLAARTRRIKLATGVVSAPYHNPFMLAERAAQLDQVSDGRFILGLGSGAYVQDQRMLGIKTANSRQMLADSATAIAGLLRGEAVSMRTDWFELNEASLQYDPVAGPIEMVLASAATPFSMELAGGLGISAMSHGGPPWGAVRAGQDIGRGGLADRWAVYDGGFPGGADRADWRIVLPVHVSDSRESALDEVFEGWWRLRMDLYRDLLGMPLPRSEIANRKALEYTVDAGGFLLGSPEEVAGAIENLADEVGGFGTLLISCPTMMPEKVRDAGLEKFMQLVAPRVSGSAARALRSASVVAAQSQRNVSEVTSARQAANQGQGGRR